MGETGRGIGTWDVGLGARDEDEFKENQGITGF
jgi:hypothetical protein